MLACLRLYVGAVFPESPPTDMAGLEKLSFVIFLFGWMAIIPEFLVLGLLRNRINLLYVPIVMFSGFIVLRAMFAVHGAGSLD